MARRMALADQAKDYQISKQAFREIHRGPVWVSRMSSAIRNAESTAQGSPLSTGTITDSGSATRDTWVDALSNRGQQ